MQFDIPEILAQLSLTPSSFGAKDAAKGAEWVFFPGQPKAGQGKGRFSEPLFSEKLKDLLKERSELHEFDRMEEEPVISISVPLKDGGNQTAVWLGDGTSTYDLQTALRKCFAEAIPEFRKKDGPKLLIDVSELSQDEASLVCESFGFLGVASGWKPFRLGVRQKKAQKSQDSFQATLQCGKLDSQKLKSDFERGAVLGRANNRVRTLADLPANVLNPQTYRAFLEKECKRLGLELEFMGIDALKKAGAGAFLAVVQADFSRGAGIAKIKYSPKGSVGKNAKPQRPLALVGKGVCYDTGGYNIKPGQYMLGMHGDMTGSALAFAMIAALSEMKADFEVHAYLALAENLISSTAYKPNEVVIALDGTAIEVVDTDAEGRMLLSDTLALARKTKPWLMIDYATLTGAAIRSLDTRRSAVFSQDRKSVV
jgi:leucyl aminopeptidase